MVTYVFPGQGSQYSGMGKDLVENFPAARLVFEEANDALSLDLASLCFTGAEADLQLTANTQPAILTTSIATLRVLEQETDLSPAYTAGHSLGEYSALVASGVISFADAVKTVRQRGTFMQEAVPVGLGAMAAIIGIDRTELEQLCQEVAEGDIVAPANYNSPGQIVIAGHATAVERVILLAKERGAKRALPLPVSAPFHSALMGPAALRLEAALESIVLNPFSCPVVSNVEATPYETVDNVKSLLIEQVCAPVRWEESIQKLQLLKVDTYIEIGPGKVLSGLIKRIDRSATTQNVGDVQSLTKLQK
ncbi:MAG: ACP S-malonyltransferase [Deltaproteobacteria bacterium]|nr:ACP S-malonyltransferase [Deltaproteobacteria bacterium]